MSLGLLTTNSANVIALLGDTGRGLSLNLFTFLADISSVRQRWQETPHAFYSFGRRAFEQH
jgi:hypothetical protein